MAITKFKIVYNSKSKIIKVSKTNKSISKIISTIEKNLEPDMKMTVDGDFQSGYGIPLGSEVYTIRIHIFNTRRSALLLGKKVKHHELIEYSFVVDYKWNFIKGPYVNSTLHRHFYKKFMQELNKKLKKEGISS